jgi:hypothetical protein
MGNADCPSRSSSVQSTKPTHAVCPLQRWDWFMETASFWNVALLMPSFHKLHKVSAHRRGCVCLSDVSSVMLAAFNVRVITLMMEAASTSEMSVNFYQTTWHNISEDSHLHLIIYVLCLGHQLVETNLFVRCHFSLWLMFWKMCGVNNVQKIAPGFKPLQLFHDFQFFWALTNNNPLYWYSLQEILNSYECDL